MLAISADHTNMFTKPAIIIIFVTFQLSNGLPLETNQTEQEMIKFFSSRIVGGVDAPYGFAKHMVALIIGYHFRALVCGGSIITERHVLTAAHCIDPFIEWDGQLSPSFTGVIGSNYWNSTETEIKFCGYRNHPEWDWHTIKNDVGVLATCEEMKFNHAVAPVGINYEWIDGGQIGSVTGWGSVEAWGKIPYRLQMLLVGVLSYEQCLRYLEEVSHFFPPISELLELCTLHSVGFGMCNGDSGSALIIQRKIAGIVSWGFPCALGIPDMFVRMSTFKPFVLESLRTM